jgi:hypothetical protein
MFFNGGPMSWGSRSQTIVALSSLEAEYIGCSDATREAIWLRRLTMEIIGPQQLLKIYGDNQGALKLVKSGIVQARTSILMGSFTTSMTSWSTKRLSTSNIYTPRRTLLTVLPNLCQLQLIIRCYNCLDYYRKG